MSSSVICSFYSEELHSGIQRVLENTSRTIPVVVNQAALNVAGRAMNLTPITDKPGMIAELGGTIAVELKKFKSGVRKGKFRGGAKLRGAAPLAAIIINARRGKAGEKGLYGVEMKKAADRLIAARGRSVGFNRTGWIPAVKRLAATLPSPFILARMSGISVIGQRKGFAIPAKQKSMSPEAILENDVNTITKIGSEALARAMDTEGADMKRHADEKLAQISLQ